MNKDLFTYIFTFVVLFFGGGYTHQLLLEKQAIILPFSLEKIYLFHASFSLIICANLRVICTVDKLLPQVGFIYLTTLLIKLILFGIFFYNPIFTIEKLSLSEKISLLIPVFIFLLTEAVFAVKILNKNN
jgi:hypothetical protein